MQYENNLEKLKTENPEGATIVAVKGDRVIHEITGSIGDFIKYLESPSEHCLVDFDLCDVGTVLLKNIRHATDQEKNKALI